MTSKTLVLVSDLDNAAHGEINILDSPEDASRFVESLIESGFDQERIRVFSAEEFSMQIHHRPVVSLLPEDQRTSKEAPPQPSPEVDATGEPEGEVERQPVTAKVATSAEEPPMVKNGVRFSSAFRPA